ncbi:regulatory protein GemA [Azospirillum sp. A39]|uniref:regulatory protein GemA n=1 Tax=Azospirillum sp. A39 TaxID=3462279 RepID=UPI0040460E75
MSGSVKASVANAKTSDPLAPLRAKVQVLRRLVPALADDDTWRAFLSVHAGGQTSTRAMAEAQLRSVVRGLHDAGAPRAAPGAGRRQRYADSAQLRMIRGLWIDLHRRGAVRDASEKALARFVQHQTRQDMGALAPAAANRVIEALKAWRDRTVPEGAAS